MQYLPNSMSLTFTTFKYFNIAFILLLSLFYHDIYDYYNKRMMHMSLTDLFGTDAKNKSYLIVSSVWCRGSNHTDRLCHFENLCYQPKMKYFIFFKSSESFISGIPENRFDPALTEMSSVVDHNRMYFNYIEIPASESLNLDTSISSGCAIILKRFNPDNLMHVFHDDLLPVFYTYKEMSLDGCKKTYMVLADDRPPGNHSILYKNFFNAKPVYLSELPDDKVLCFSNSYVGLNKFTVWYQYGFKEPQGALVKNYAGMSNVIKKFTVHFKQQFGISEATPTSKIALFLIRKHNRRILNEEILASAIRNHTNLKVLTVGLEDYSIIQIAELISLSKIVVGMHGSLLILSMFLPEDSALIELFPFAIPAEYYTPYRTLANFPGLGILYQSWENKQRANSISYPKNQAEFGGIEHLPLKEQNHIKQMSVVYPQMCCYSPEWLYYIYQDTVVDIPSFLVVLQNSMNEIDNINSKNIFEHKTRSAEQDIYPGDVSNLTCSKTTKSAFYLSWSIPWNLKFINYTSLEYEIWLQLLETGSTTAYITKKSHFTVAVGNVPFYVWIRCQVDERCGPFNNDPQICQQ